MDDDRKGRACVISLPTFETPSLDPLDGYNEDARQLGQLLKQIGFEVYEPIIRASRSLSALVSHFYNEDYLS